MKKSNFRAKTANFLNKKFSSTIRILTYIREGASYSDSDGFASVERP